MAGLVDSISDTVSLFKGFDTVSPMLTMAMGASRGRRYQRLQRKAQKELDGMEKARKEGSIKNFQKHFREYIHTIMIEEDMQDKEVRAEEKIEMNIAGDFRDVIYSLKADKKMQEEVRKIEKIWLDFSKEHFQKLSVMKAGGRPFEGMTEIANYSRTDCTNIIITTFRNLRPQVDMIGSNLKALKNIGPVIYEAKKSKAKQEYIQKMETKAQDHIKKLNESSIRSVNGFRTAFYVSLRLWTFIKSDIEEADRYLDKVREQGLPKKKTEKDKQLVAEALQKMKDLIDKETEGSNRIIQSLERAA